MLGYQISLFAGLYSFLFFFKQKTAYEMRISDWSSDVCSSDLIAFSVIALSGAGLYCAWSSPIEGIAISTRMMTGTNVPMISMTVWCAVTAGGSEKHTSEIQSLMGISYAVLFCTHKQSHRSNKSPTVHQRHPLDVISIYSVK